MPLRNYSLTHNNSYGHDDQGGEAENARHETMGKETTATKISQNAGGGNCEKRKQRHRVAGVENARHEYSGKAEYGKLLIVKYM